jgi:hypothetical protein
VIFANTTTEDLLGRARSIGLPSRDRAVGSLLSHASNGILEELACGAAAGLNGSSAQALVSNWSQWLSGCLTPYPGTLIACLGTDWVGLGAGKFLVGLTVATTTAVWCMIVGQKRATTRTEIEMDVLSHGGTQIGLVGGRGRGGRERERDQPLSRQPGPGPSLCRQWDRAG